MPCDANVSWTNWAGNIAIEPFRCCSPENLDQVMAVVQEAEGLGRHVRACGSHWSFSDIGITGDYLVETRQLNSTLTNVIPNALCEEAKSRKLYHVEAGITLHELYKRLNKDLGWALPTLSASGGQTLAGAISTSSHGSDFNLPPMADMVQAIHFVGPRGIQYWVERNAAITSLNKLSAVLPDINPSNIHYDDDWFYSVLVSMGCMGIIYSLVLEVRLQFGLSELRTRSSWRTVRPLLAEGTIFSHLPSWVKRKNSSESTFIPRFLEIVINPYKDNQSDHSCTVTFREEIPTPAHPTGQPGKNLFDLLCERSSINIRLLVIPLIFFVVFSGAFLYMPWLLLALIALLFLNFTVSGLLASIINVASLAGLAWLVRELIDLVLSLGRPAETDHTDISYKILDSYDYQAPAINCYKVLSMELVLDATNNSYLNFIDEMFRIVDQAVEQRMYIAGLFALRFTSQSNGYLAIQQYKRTCTIEISPLAAVAESSEILRRFEDAVLLYGGRAHWGQVFSHCYAHTYPNFPRWQVIYAALTNDGTLCTFENDFSLRCGLSGRPNQPQ